MPPQAILINAPLTIAVYISAIFLMRADDRSLMAAATARTRGASFGVAAAMLVTGASLLVYATTAAISQQSPGLRGAISQVDLERQLLPR